MSRVGWALKHESTKIINLWGVGHNANLSTWVGLGPPAHPLPPPMERSEEEILRAECTGSALSHYLHTHLP